MRALAELIEVAFSSNLEPESKRMLGWMKWIGRLGWFGWLLSLYVLPPAARPQGFVWVSDGRLVGNASVLPVGGHPGRWIMVNVAVHPEFQRQGIARQLVQACVACVRQHKGRVLLLQTESDNPGAHVLYTDLGFEAIAERTTWVGQFDKRRYHLSSKGLARPRSRDEWRAQINLARRVYPEGLIWPYPLGANIFRTVGLFDSIVVGGNRHWVVEENGELVGSLSLRWSPEIDAWRMLLVVDPKAEGKIEGDLLVCGLADLPIRRARIEMEYPSGVAESQLTDLGFNEKRRLTWMKCELEDRDGSSINNV
jgi:ribosomal protein S18 acetylase RimI-like enzyme